MSETTAPSRPPGGRHRLVVLRHGKAEGFATDDAARRLTGSGREDAAARGRWLAPWLEGLDLALVSSATRTQETWGLVSEELSVTPEVRVEDGLYGASPDAVLDLLRELPESIGTAIYVGHNPTAASLALLLHDGSGDPEAFSSLSLGLSTCGVAVYDLDGTWAEVDAGSGSLAAFEG